MNFSETSCEMNGITKSIFTPFFLIETGLDIFKNGVLFHGALEHLSREDWEKWVTEEVGFSVFMAERFIRVARLCLRMPSLKDLDADTVYTVSELPEIKALFSDSECSDKGLKTAYEAQFTSEDDYPF